MNKKIFWCLAALMVILFTLAACGGGSTSSTSTSSGSSASSDYPSRTINFVIPYDPGGGVDGNMRQLAEALAKEMDVNIVCENMPGAGSLVAWNHVMTQPSDGYTITSVTGVANPWTSIAADPDAFAWDPDDWTIIGGYTGTPSSHGLICLKDAPWADFGEFVRDARTKPAGYYNVGIMGPNQITDPQIWDTERIFGIDLNTVYYSSSNEIQTDVLTGDIQLGLIGCNSERWVDHDTMRVLTLFGNTFDPRHPVQTLPKMSDFEEEFGFSWDEDVKYWGYTPGDALVIKSDAPPEIIEYWKETFKKVVDTDEFFQAFYDRGGFSTYTSPEDYRAGCEIWANAMRDFAEYQASQK